MVAEIGWAETATALLALAGAVLGAAAVWFTSLTYRKQAALLRTAALVEPRVAAYSALMGLLEAYGDDVTEPPRPNAVPFANRRQLAADMRHWYYRQGGWLMDGDTFNSYRAARQQLLTETAAARDVYDALSALRTEMKIELGARELSEQSQPFARSKSRLY